MKPTTFYKTLRQCRETITCGLPDDKVRLDFDSRLYAESLHEDLEVVLKNLAPGARALDLGCGKGHISALLAEAGCRITGLDVPQTPGEQLEIASAWWQTTMWVAFQERWPVRYRYYDGTAIPMSDASVDGVILYAVLEHVAETDRVPLLKDIVRVLRPGGYLFIAKCPRGWALAEHLAAALSLPHHKRLVSEHELRAWLEEAGLMVITMERTDLLPAFPPPALQGFWNRLAPLLRALEHVLRYTPWVLLAHHVRAVAQKNPPSPTKGS